MYQGAADDFLGPHDDVALPSEADQIETNLAMLVNLVESVEKCSPNFEHITLMQGAKAYGVHHGVPRLMPAKEAHGRYMSPNFYYNRRTG